MPFPKGTIEKVHRLADRLKEKHGISSLDDPTKPPHGLAWYIEKRRQGLESSADGPVPDDLEAILKTYGEDEPARKEAMAEYLAAAQDAGFGARFQAESLIVIPSASVAFGDGGSRNRFWKEIFRAGRYEHPQRPGESFVADQQRLEQWMRNFNAGVMETVFVTWGHPQSAQDLIEHAHGRVLKLKIEGRGMEASLWALVSVDDETASRINAGLIGSVSVGIQERRTKFGEDVGEVLQHLAITNDPFVTHMEPFEMAAGGESRRVPVRTFERSSTMNRKAKLSAMDNTKLFAAHGTMVDLGDADGAADAVAVATERFAKQFPGKDFPGMEAARGSLVTASGSGSDVLSAEVAQLTSKLGEVEASNLLLAEQAKAQAAELKTLQAERKATREAGIRSRVEGWMKAAFGLQPAVKDRVTALLLATADSTDVVTFDAGGKQEKVQLHEALVGLFDAITAGGLVPLRRESKVAGAPLGGQHEPAEPGSVGKPVDMRAAVNAYCEKVGEKKFDFEATTKDPKEAARYRKVLQVAVKAGEISLG